MKIATVEPWIEPPLQRFLDDARVRLALLLHPSGQVVAQVGFARAVDVMSACALAAAIHASGAELGRQLQGRPFAELYHADAERQLFLSAAETARGSFVFMTVFDGESSIGLVRIFFETLRRELAAATPRHTPVRGPVLAADFERELNRNLAALFGGERPTL